MKLATDICGATELPLFAFAVALALAVSGCATPEPVKLDPSKIAVEARPEPATAGSIWPGETTRNSLFQDMRARQVGDIVTVEISEKTSAIKEASTSTSRKATRSGNSVL